MPTKTIKFEFFTVKKAVFNNEKADFVPVDLHEDLKNIYELPFSEKVKEYGNNGIVLYQYSFNGVANITELQFAKIRDALLPSIIDEAGKCRDVELGERESLVEFTNILYDFKHGVFMIQKNQNGVSTGQIWEYLENCLTPLKLEFSAIVSPEQLSQFVSGTIVRNLVITVASSIDIEDPSIKQLAKQAKETGAKFFTYAVSLGRAKQEDSLVLSKIKNLIEPLLKRPETTKARISAKLPGCKRAEVFDLVEGRMQAVMPFAYDREHLLTPDRVQAEMKKLYADKKDELLDYING